MPDLSNSRENPDKPWNFGAAEQRLIVRLNELTLKMEDHKKELADASPEAELAALARFYEGTSSEFKRYQKQKGEDFYRVMRTQQRESACGEIVGNASKVAHLCEDYSLKRQTYSRVEMSLEIEDVLIAARNLMYALKGSNS